MKKVAGRLKIELSQYRDLEAFAQFGSDLDPDTQRTLARGERLVKTLNQGERTPLRGRGPGRGRLRRHQRLPGPHQRRPRAASSTTAWSSACTPRRRTCWRRSPAATGPTRRRRRCDDAIEQFADDFGYDLDEEGQPLADGATSCAPRRAARGATSDERRGADERAEPRRRRRRRPPAPWRSRTSRAGSRRSRTSRRSRARWRWSPPRACAGPSSASRRCGPYAGAIRRMTRQAAEAAGNVPNLPILNEHESERHGRRSCSSPATAAWPARSTRRSSAPACARRPSTRASGQSTAWYASGPPRRVVADLPRPRGRAAPTPASPTARPTPTRARSPRT